jgi:hypothetical protein
MKTLNSFHFEKDSLLPILGVNHMPKLGSRHAKKDLHSLKHVRNNLHVLKQVRKCLHMSKHVRMTSCFEKLHKHVKEDLYVLKHL